MRKSIIILLLFLSTAVLFLQETDAADIPVQESELLTGDGTVNTETVTENNRSGNQGFIFITAGPQLFYNAEGIPSSPSPIILSIGTGGNIPIDRKFFSFTPHIKGWASYYIWYNDKALPGPVEHRTSYTLHALLDIPVSFKLSAGDSVFSLGLGMSILARLGFAVPVLPEDEKPDIKKMNAYYWQKARFLYPCLILAWDYLLENGTSFGFEARAHYPLSNFNDPSSSPIQSALLSVSGRFFFPRKW